MKADQANTVPRTRGAGAGSAILPDRLGLVATFWEGARSGKLLLQKCSRCGHYWHPVAEVCEACQSFDFEWTPSTGIGTVYSYTVVHHAVHPVVEPWLPYTLCLVALAEGPRILATVEPDDGSELQIGTAVHLAFRRITETFQLPVFRLPTPACTGFA